MKFNFDFDQLLTVSCTLFAVIDIIGSIPLLHALKKKLGGLHEGKATLISGAPPCPALSRSVPDLSPDQSPVCLKFTRRKLNFIK